jgi:hypothetical protein
LFSRAGKKTEVKSDYSNIDYTSPPSPSRSRFGGARLGGVGGIAVTEALGMNEKLHRKVSPPFEANLYTHLHELVADYLIVCLKGFFLLA